MKKRISTLLEQLSKREIRFNQKAYIFLFCLLLSTFFWFLSAFSKTYTTTLNAPLEYNTLSEEFILTKPPAASVNINVSGSGFELLGEQMSLNKKKTLVDLNLARPTSSADRYFILTSMLKDKLRMNLDPDIELLSIGEDSLLLRTEKRLSKKIKIVPQVELKLEKGYKQRGEITVTPNVVSLSGPQGFIDSVHTLYTEVITTNQLKDSMEKVVSIQLPKDINGLAVNPEKVEVLIPVEMYTEKVLTLAIKSEVSTNSRHQLQTFPNEVKVTFLVPLSKYNNLNESTLSAVVVYGKEHSESKKLSVKINNIPKYALLTKLEPERVEYILKK